MKGNHTNWDEKHLLDKGYIKDGSGNWYKPELKSPINEKEQLVQLITTGAVIPIKEELKESIFTIDGLVAGLNSSGGLMRAHWSKISKQKELYQQMVRNQFAEGKLKKHIGKVRVRYVGYKSNFMDWDNFCSSAKLPLDALVKEGIILDDNPKIVTEFVPRMIKCPRSEQRVLVIIQDIE